ncbi:MAG: hypothetical protein ACKO6N_22380 [Myxococcota bacterium]
MYRWNLYRWHPLRHLLATLGGSLLVLSVACSSAPPQDPPEHFREVASKLAAAGVKGEAARYYERYLADASVPAEKRAAVALALAKLLKEEGRLEEALGWLYQVEGWAPGSAHAKEASPLVVELLERLGKTQAAQTALDARASLQKTPAGSTSASQNGTPIARIGTQNLTTADLDDALEALPAALREQLKAPEQKRRFLEQFVAQELLYQKALKRGIEKDPALRKQLVALEKQLTIARLLEADMAGVKPTEQDLQNLYTAQAERFKSADGNALPFEQVRSQVEATWQMQQLESRSQRMLQEAQAAQEVQLFPEAIGAMLQQGSTPSPDTRAGAGTSAGTSAGAGGTP